MLLYDNLRSAVLERHGDAIRFHPELLRFASRYRFEPRPVAVARGNEKGRVERAIRYVRDAFFAARQFADLDDLNAQAAAWCHGPAAARRCPDQPELSVAEAFTAEQPQLLPLPDAPPSLLERVVVRIGKTPYARFDGNDYSIPHTHVGRSLTLLADPHEVRITDGAQVLARHRRSYDKGTQVEDAHPRSRPWSPKNTPPASTAPPTTWRRPRRPAKTCCAAPPSVATTSAPSPLPCCACSTPMAPPNCRRRHPGSALARCAASRTPCASPSIAGAPSAASRRRSPSCCPSMSAPATAPCSRIGSTPTTG